MPVQQGLILTQAKVRVPSKFTLFVFQTIAGGAGAVAAAGVAEALKRNTRLSPSTRALMTLATGVLGGALVGRNSPRIGSGLALGGVAAAIPAALEALETEMATRDMAPMQTQVPAPVPAPSPTPAPAPATRTAPAPAPAPAPVPATRP